VECVWMAEDFMAEMPVRKVKTAIALIERGK
jgi:hypothetical protein